MIVTTLVVIAGFPVTAAGAGSELAGDSLRLGSGVDPSSRSSFESGNLTEPSVSFATGPTTGMVNSTTRVNLTLDEAPGGLAGYRIKVMVGDGSVASIEAATVPSAFGINRTTVGASNETVELEAVDLGEDVQSGASNVRLASIEIRRVGAGESTLAIDIEEMDNDAGSAIAPTTRNTTVRVTACQPLTPDLPMPTDPDGDGDYEDANGNKRLDYDDMVTFFKYMDSAPIECHDFNDNGRIGFDDVVSLFEDR